MGELRVGIGVSVELASHEIELLRTCFVGNAEKWAIAFRDAVEAGGSAERPMHLMNALLAELAGRTFDSGISRSGVVKFVASVRIRRRDGEGWINPEYAEQLVLAALGQKKAAEAASTSPLGDEQKTRIQLAITSALAEDLQLDAEGRSDLLAKMAVVANAS